jgi:hypothetical protein
MSCEKCWSDAYLRWMSDPSKTQAEHYKDLIDERQDNPCFVAANETVSISALWLRNIDGKAQVLVEVRTEKRGRRWYPVIEESLTSAGVTWDTFSAMCEKSVAF